MGWGLTEESDNVSYHLAASNFVFATLAQEQYTRTLRSDFDDLTIKEVRRKAGKIRSAQRDGALKAQCNKWQKTS